MAIYGFAHDNETVFYFSAYMRLKIYVQVCPPEDILQQQKEPLSFINNSKVVLFLM